MKLKRLLPLFSLLILMACSKEEPALVEAPKTASPVVTKEVLNNRINYAELQDGQVSYYKRYRKTCGLDNFEYTGDTLIVEVLNNGNDFYFQEDLTLGSPMKSQGFFATPFSYIVRSEGDNLLVPDREGTQLFYFYGNDTIRLNPTHDANLVQNDCYLLQEQSNFVGDDIGFAEDFKIGIVEEKKKTVVSCVPMVLEVEAYLIYDQKQLYISHVIWEDEFFGQAGVVGWELIE